MTLKDFMGIIRAPFLILAPMCVLLGVSTVYSDGNNISIFNLILVFLAGILSHISVNSLNEYFDFKNGLDFKTIKTPFSGGSGTLVNKPHLSNYALGIGLISAIFVVFIGLYFVYLRGEQVLIFGILGIIMVLFYPIIFVKNVFLSLISPGLGFGTAMVIGTHIALGGEINLKVLLASIIPFFLVNNLLLLNQFPDKEADESVGRSNLVIRIGRRYAAYVYAIFNLLAYLTIIFGIFRGEFNLLTALSFTTIIFAIPASIKAFRDSDNLTKLLPAQGMNVIINLLTPLLLAIGLFLK